MALTNIREMQITADEMHQELLELISSLSDGTASDRVSSVCESFSPVVCLN
jgi:hypothetical protein